jgi:hypothetical protein
MSRNIFLVSVLLVLSLTGKAQPKAKAISYVVEIDLTRFNPEAAEELEETKCTYEVDVYYTDQHVKTMVRNIRQPVDITLRQRQYEIASTDEYNIDHKNKFILLKKDQRFKPSSTGNKKTILGYACREYTLKDYRDVQFSVWMTEKLPKNICPAGNFSVKGTVLELTASNGLHYLATDFAEGELDPGFFQLPADYEQEVSMPPASSKKSK